MVEQSTMYEELAKYIKLGWIDPSSSTLIVCGGQFDHQVLSSLSFTDYVISSIQSGNYPEIPIYRQEDAQNLSFEQDSFDTVIVHNGLHHCSSPHRAVTEMYRVARSNVLIFESQDSYLMKIAERLGFTSTYEHDAVSSHPGGVEDTETPNYIYRWSTRELQKVIRAYDPFREPNIHFERYFMYRSVHMSGFLANHWLTRTLGVKITGFLLTTATRMANIIAKRQGNIFVALIRKNASSIHPWIIASDVDIHRVRQEHE